MSRIYNPGHFPVRSQCGICDELFEEGEEIIARMPSLLMSTAAKYLALTNKCFQIGKVFGKNDFPRYNIEIKRIR